MGNRKTKQRPPNKAKETFENDPTAERVKQAGGIVDQFRTDSGRQAKRLGSILDHMLSHNMIDGTLYQAGMMAYRLWYMGGLSPVGAVDLSKVKVDGGGGGSIELRLDHAKKHRDAMGSLSAPHRRAYEVLVLHEIHVAVFGLQYYNYKDVASARAVAYATLKDALAVLETHFMGGKRNTTMQTRSHMQADARPTNRADLRDKVE